MKIRYRITVTQEDIGAHTGLSYMIFAQNSNISHQAMFRQLNLAITKGDRYSFSKKECMKNC
jgi:hypothetical protein